MKKTTKLAVAIAAATFGTAAYAQCGGVAQASVHPQILVEGVLTDACELGDDDGALTADGSTAIDGETISSSITLDSDFVWVIRGKVAVGTEVTSPNVGGVFTITEVNGPSITIEPGTIIIGDNTNDDTDPTILDTGQVPPGPSANPDRLIINRGSQIIADGTIDQPIRFTGRQNVENGDLSLGQFGGLYINGYGLNNRCENVALGAAANTPTNCERPGEANTGRYGGNSNDDNSGILDYVTVSFAGATFNVETDLNGIAFQSVGSDTQVSNIQVHENVDDGVEFYGGAVNATNVVLTNNHDDSHDTTEGWLGRIQFMVIVQGGTDNDSAFESDNGANAGTNAFPETNGDIANLTVIKTNADSSRLFRIRDASSLDVFNAVLDFPVGDCVDTAASAPAPFGGAGNFSDPSSFDTILAECDAGAFAVDPDAVEANITNVASGSLTLDGVVNGTLENGITPAALPAGFQSVNFVGAVESCDTNWTAGWTIPGSLPANSLGADCAPQENAVPVMGWAGLAALFAGIASIAARVNRVQ